jgi:predicted PurR-regulated permease PerM
MSDKKEKVVFEISIASVLKVILLLLGVWVLYQVRSILVILLVVMIIAIALEPFVEKLEKDRIPRSLSVIVLYLALLVVLGAFIYFVIPPVALQIKELTLDLPYYTSRLSNLNLGDTSPVTKILDNLSSNLTDSAGSILAGLISVFGGVVYAITVFALTFYALVDKEGVRKTLVALIPTDQKERLLATINKVSLKLGDWLRGQLLLMLIIGVVDGSILAILGIQYALVLGLLAGLLEVIPIIGPTISALTAVFVAFVSGVALWKILVILAAYIVVQQIDNQILVPKIMQKATGLSPIIVIIALLVGDKLLGLGGAILAIPVAAGIQVFTNEYMPFMKKG